MFPPVSRYSLSPQTVSCGNLREGILPPAVGAHFSAFGGAVTGSGLVRIKMRLERQSHDFTSSGVDQLRWDFDVSFLSASRSDRAPSTIGRAVSTLSSDLERAALEQTVNRLTEPRGVFMFDGRVSKGDSAAGYRPVAYSADVLIETVFRGHQQHPVFRTGNLERESVLLGKSEGGLSLGSKFPGESLPFPSLISPCEKSRRHDGQQNCSLDDEFRDGYSPRGRHGKRKRQKARGHERNQMAKKRSNECSEFLHFGAKSSPILAARCAVGGDSSRSPGGGSGRRLRPGRRGFDDRPGEASLEVGEPVEIWIGLVLVNDDGEPRRLGGRLSRVTGRWEERQQGAPDRGRAFHRQAARVDRYSIARHGKKRITAVASDPHAVIACSLDRAASGFDEGAEGSDHVAGDFASGRAANAPSADRQVEERRPGRLPRLLAAVLCFRHDGGPIRAGHRVLSFQENTGGTMRRLTSMILSFLGGIVGAIAFLGAVGANQAPEKIAESRSLKKISADFITARSIDIVDRNGKRGITLAVLGDTPSILLNGKEEAGLSIHPGAITIQDTNGTQVVGILAGGKAGPQIAVTDRDRAATAMLAAGPSGAYATVSPAGS
jgi:hypothetical protein